MIGKVLEGIQAILLLAMAVSWAAWLVTGKEPTTFVSAMWVTIGVVIMYGLIMLINKVVV